MILILRCWSELESKVREVRHLSWAGVGVEEVEEMGVIGYKAMAEVDGFHWRKEGMGSVVVVITTWSSCQKNVSREELALDGWAHIV